MITLERFVNTILFVFTLMFLGMPFDGVLISLGVVVLYFVYKKPLISKVLKKEQKLWVNDGGLSVVVDLKKKKYKTMINPKKEIYS